jgi:hypothetical protein
MSFVFVNLDLDSHSIFPGRFGHLLCFFYGASDVMLAGEQEERCADSVCEEYW